MIAKSNCRGLICERGPRTMALTAHVVISRYPNYYGSDSHWFKAPNQGEGKSVSNNTNQ